MRDNLRPVALALLCVLAIGLAAATLGNPIDPGQDGSADRTESETQRSDQEPGSGAQGRPDIDATPSGVEGDGEDWEYCYEPLEGEPVGLYLTGFVLGLGAIVGTVSTRTRGLAVVLFGFWLSLIPMLLLVGGCDVATPTQETSDKLINSASEAVADADGDEQPLNTPTSLIAVLLVVATIGIVAAVFLRDSDDSEEERPPGRSLDDEQRQEAIGTAAGEAADRIEADAELENEVYRAWAEMAEPLPVERPETSTPSEFAEAATESGIQPDDVRELTTLFEEVRYGTAEATEQREQQAVTALRRIERTYADSGDGASGAEASSETDDDAAGGGRGSDGRSGGGDEDA